MYNFMELLWFDEYYLGTDKVVKHIQLIVYLLNNKEYSNRKFQKNIYKIYLDAFWGYACNIKKDDIY